MVDLSVVTFAVIYAGLLGAIVWDLITWFYGLPTSSSHALFGGYAGAAIVKAGFGALIPSGWTKTLLFLILSPLIGLTVGFAAMAGIYWVSDMSRLVASTIGLDASNSPPLRGLADAWRERCAENDGHYCRRLGRWRLPPAGQRAIAYSLVG